MLLLRAALLVCFLCAAAPGADSVIHWNRLRPLDHDPRLNSRVPLNRPCVPGETVVMGQDVGQDSQASIGLDRGEFVVCIDNTDAGELVLVDGLGREWRVARSAVHSTAGFPANWLAFDRDYLVWAYSRDTIILRESLRNSFEGNFLYLLLDLDESGEARAALLIDSGTGLVDLKPYVLPVVGDAPLTVVSTHSHWDHFGGHRHFLGLENVRLLGYHPGSTYTPYPEGAEYSVEGVAADFGIQNWPEQNAEYAVGSRTVEALPIPGHTLDAIALYDRREELLFTGDSVYPGFLFIDDWAQAAWSLAKLERFCDERPVRYVLGGHVEVSKRKSWNGMFERFYFGTNTHFDEHPVQMPTYYVSTARDILTQMIERSGDGTPVYDARILDPPFQRQPMAPIPFDGIPDYFSENTDRLVGRLRERHAEMDAAR